MGWGFERGQDCAWTVGQVAWSKHFQATLTARCCLLLLGNKNQLAANQWEREREYEWQSETVAFVYEEIELAQLRGEIMCGAFGSVPSSSHKNKQLWSKGASFTRNDLHEAPTQKPAEEVCKWRRRRRRKSR